MQNDLGVGAPVEPSRRPRKQRAAARVVVVCAGRYLVQERFDPGLPAARWLSTPGGGIDPGEDARQAAVRELGEELGVDVDPAELRGPVARRVVIHGYTDQIAEQAEEYFVWEVGAEFTPTIRLQTPREQVSSGAWGWFDEAGLAEQWVWDDVVTIAAFTGDTVVDLGVEELSSVPVRESGSPPAPAR